MSDKKNNKTSYRQNKKNEIGRPESKLSNKKLPPTYENFNGEPIDK